MLVLYASWLCWFDIHCSNLSSFECRGRPDDPQYNFLRAEILMQELETLILVGFPSVYRDLGEVIHGNFEGDVGGVKHMVE